MSELDGSTSEPMATREANWGRHTPNAAWVNQFWARVSCVELGLAHLDLAW